MDSRRKIFNSKNFKLCVFLRIDFLLLFTFHFITRIVELKIFLEQKIYLKNIKLSIHELLFILLIIIKFIRLIYEINKIIINNN